MGKKLSIQQRQYSQTGWHKSSQFSSTDIKDIKVDRAVNDKSLNAIPSPFARIHLFETAFDLLDKDELNNTDFAGDAYKKIVSDCFDVFELIYNWNTHLKDGKNLSISKWDKDIELLLLKNSTSRKHKMLGESLQVFSEHDVFDNFTEVLIIKINNQVIAGSSPFTGFFTSPNDNAGVPLFNPINKRNYFSHIIPFKDRKPAIKRFIYDFFFKLHHRQITSFNTVQNYLHKYNSSINQSLVMQLEALKSPNGREILLANDVLMSNASKTVVDYFESSIIRLKYRINDDCFVVPSNNNIERNHDYLLPFTAAFFADFDINSISSLVSIKELDEKSIEVKVNSSGGSFIKRYELHKLSEEDGQIIEMDQIKLNVGIFPFLKVVDPNQDVDYNDFFKVSFIFQDNSYLYKNADFNLGFGKNGELLENGNVFYVKKEDRTIFAKDKANVGSSYYSLNTIFDYILLSLPGDKGVKINNAIVPKWPTKELGRNRIDYSIDFGTTTTFVSYTDDPEHGKEPKRFELTEKEIPVQFLNQPKTKRQQYNWIDCFEEALNAFPESILVQKQEFLPSVLRSDEKYGMPLRSVLYQRKNIQETQKSLFSNTNIGFTYQKENNYATEHDQEFVPNLKWNIHTDEHYKKSIELFLEELFYLIRLKTLFLDGDPRKCNISWFSPLSFTSAAKAAYSKIWKGLFSKVLKTDNFQQLKDITESEAPFYYLYKKAAIKDTAAVLTLDIGGGSTDLMYFINNSPVMGSSVNFGANVLWGNGFNDFTSDKSNGIFNLIKETIGTRLRTDELNVLNETFISENSPYGADEIINFWIINEEKTKVSSDLARPNFKLGYLLHLSAILYQSFKLLQHHGENAPTCIIFSGNGSKYIDLIQGEPYINRICSYFVERIFPSAEAQLQIILPAKNRKEATCFGGLYHPNDQFSTFSQNYFLGFESKSDVNLKYSDIDIKRDLIFSKLDDAFSDFIEAFFKMDEVPGLNFRTEFGVNQKLASIKGYILANAHNFLKIGYEKRRNKVEGDDQITDSLFFYPLVGLLYKINVIGNEELAEYQPRTFLYPLSPNIHGEFEAQSIKTSRQAESIFIISLENTTDNSGELLMIDDPSSHKRAITSINSYLKPVCDFVYPSNVNQSINVISPGKVKRTPEGWSVTKKIEIEFI